MAAVKTKAPTGLAIKRNKNTYTLTWKKGDKDYADGQTCVFRCNNDKFANQTVSAGTTSRSVAVDMTKYYPNTSKMLSRVQFGIRGNRKAYEQSGTTIDPTVSDWTYKEFTFNKPSTPSGSASLSQTYSNVCTFSWSEKVDVASHVHFADCEYQSILVKDCTETDGSKQKWSRYNMDWRTGTTGATYSLSITEQTELLAADSYTRWVRVRARGARGASAWRYIKHVYARPNQAKIKTATVKQTDAGGYLCSVEWVVGAGAAHPIDKVTVQYALAVPMAGMECPDGASWTDASVTRDTTGADKAAFSVDTTVGDDQCLFVRVNTEHDTNITYGAAKAATTGYLADPTDLSVTTSDSTHRATVTATNASDVADSYLLIRYTSATYPKGLAIGIIPHGQTSATVQCPTWASGEAIGFSVQAVVGAYVTSTDEAGVTTYTLKKYLMRSRNRLTYGGSVPQPPSNVSLAMTDTVGTVQVTFDWAWQDARAAELSWANHADAWQSTDEPDTYVIDNTNASVWNISGLEVGQTWYVRVRLVGGTEDAPTYGGYSDTVSIDLASEPITPVLTLSSGIITDGGTVTASWVYVSTDTTLQAYAEVAEYDGTDYTVIASTETAQQVNINASEVEWSTGEEHALAVRVVSASGRKTGWSEPVSVMVAEPLVCEITATSLEEVVGGKNQFNVDALDSLPEENGVTTTLTLKPNTTYTMSTNHPLSNSDAAFVFFKLLNQEIDTSVNGAWADHPHSVTTGADGLADVVCRSQDSETLETFKTYWFQVEEGSAVTDYEEYTTIQALTALPLTLTVTGAGEGGTTTVAIERAEAYHVTRPDETDLHGYEGETVALMSQMGEAQISIGLTDLIGRLDDGAHYRLVASISDGLGQSASESIDFWVVWEHQAIIPDGTVTIDTDHLAAMLVPVAPTGTVQGDVCDIYRLSVDRPQLIYEDATFGQTYVDPYPTLGAYGGYRFVFKSKEGDYINASNEMAWKDVWTDIIHDASIIDFGTGRVELEYNVDVSNAWKKDFKETKYLGGSVQGDWNPAVSRTATVGGVAIVAGDPETIEAVRRLAVYPGLCHIRTKEGSSYPADVQVNESYAVSEGHKIANFSLKITRVDSEELDGMTLAEWQASHQEE